jgi:O-antigen/teichoic acid export membrane protein
MAQRTQRLIEAARKPMPEGTFVVGAGLLVAALSAYGFQILTFRSLSKADYTALNGLWVFVFVAAPGLFLPLEQEVGRAISDRRARGLGGKPVVRRATVLGIGLAGALTILTVAAVASTSLLDRLFDGRDALSICLVVAFFTYCAQHLTRGTLAGSGRFGPYGLILATEGVLRLLPTAVLAGFGVDEPVYYGLALAIPPVLASIISLRSQHGLLSDGPEAQWSELSTNLGYLLFASLSAQVLSYAPFLGAKLLASTDREKELVADFIVGFFLARIPVVLFQAVQAALLPKLAHLTGSGRHDDFRNGLRKLVLVVIGIAAAGVLGGATLGPPVGEILFGEKFNLDRLDLALLAGGTGLFILALTLAQALIALLGHSRVLVAWLAGIAVFVIVTALGGDDLFKRVEIGFIPGAFTSAALMGWMLWRRLQRDIPEGTLAHFVEQIEHEPLEI